jgi:hypothetical protein
VSADPDVADPTSARPVLTVRQPYANHNGGHLLFGPDGMLYVGMGDGGSGGDPQGHAQDRRDPLGNLLRLDVDGGEPYAIPRDNPYAGSREVRPEIWAYGLRNPWRFAFDPPSGLLFIADVGQNTWEEINVAPANRGGLNYGWNLMEGRHPYRPAGRPTTGLTAPLLEYRHGRMCSVIGGFVYRGRRVPQLVGRYVFSDYCAGRLRSFRVEGGRAVELREWAGVDAGPVTSFGVDGAGELYVMNARGELWRVATEVGAAAGAPAGGVDGGPSPR